MPIANICSLQQLVLYSRVLPIPPFTTTIHMILGDINRVSQNHSVGQCCRYPEIKSDNMSIYLRITGKMSWYSREQQQILSSLPCKECRVCCAETFCLLAFLPQPDMPSFRQMEIPCKTFLVSDSFFTCFFCGKYFPNKNT